jgi:hypothetical protein
MQAAQMLGGYSWAAPTCCAARWARRRPRRWPSSASCLPRRARPRASPGREGRRGLRPDGEVRRLRLQQEPRRRVLAAGLPHGLDQGALHGRVLRRQHDGRVGRHRQAEGAAGRCQAVRHRLRAARRQPRRLPLRAGGRPDRALRPGCRQGHRPRRDRGHRRRARRQCARGGAAPFRSLFDFCARVDRKRINKRVVEALVKAGAFDLLHAEGRRRRRAAGQRGPGLRLGRHAGRECLAGRAVRHFGDGRMAAPPRSRRWWPPRLGRARAAAQEKTALGFYLSGHLFDKA